jgi:hypothetical protein
MRIGAIAMKMPGIQLSVAAALVMMSAAEAKDFGAKVQELTTAARLDAGTRIAGDAGFAQSTKSVEDSVFNDLKATKTMPDEVARTNAILHSRMVASLAAEDGSTPEAFYEAHKASIQQAGKTAFAQSGTPDRVGSLSELTGNMDETERRYDGLGQPNYVSGDRVKELLQGWSDKNNPQRSKRGSTRTPRRSPTTCSIAKLRGCRRAAPLTW